MFNFINDLDRSDAKNIIENLLSSLVFLAFGFLAGRWSKARSIISTRRRVRLADQSSLANSSLLTVSGSRFELTGSQLQARVSNDEFRLPFPEAFKEEMQSVAPTFLFNQAVQTTRIVKMMNDANDFIPNLDEILSTASVEVAIEFIDRGKKIGRLFNGILYHPTNLVSAATQDDREDPIVSVDFYATDYFTHQVIHRAFCRLREEREVIKYAISKGQLVNNLRFFWNGFGLNCLVCAVPDRTQPARDAVLIFGRRSNRVGQNAATGTWHVTANEALSQTDVEDQRISIDRWIRRALHEEVGIAETQIVRRYIFSVVIGLNDMQPGMTCLAFCELDFSSIESRIAGSQDGTMENDAYAILAFDTKSITGALRNKGLVHEEEIIPFSPSADNILRNIVARGTESFMT